MITVTSGRWASKACDQVEGHVVVEVRTDGHDGRVGAGELGDDGHGVGLEQAVPPVAAVAAERAVEDVVQLDVELLRRAGDEEAAHWR